MTYDSEYYYAVQTFLEDDELYKIWNIIEIAMNREGYDCLLYTSPSPRDSDTSRMPSSS